MSRFFQTPDCATQYRAIGLVRGQYLPSLEAFQKGVLLTDDGVNFPAIMFKRLARQLQKHPERLNTHLFWSVWPRNQPNEPGLFLELNALRSSRDEQQQVRLTRSVNEFSIRGIVVFQDAVIGKLAIRIERNRTTRQGLSQSEFSEPFNLELSGFLPGQALGQFWELECCRDGEHLVMENAHLVTESPPRQLELPMKASIGEQPDYSPKSSLVANSPKTKKANHRQPVQPALYRGEIMPTPGKMELTIKINQFPVDVKTVANGWKQFNVEADGQIVAIIVKPKVFKKLEEAQANYLHWVAAIAGQIGDKTDFGFVLKEPNIQVFERKPKEPKEATTIPVASAAG